MSPATLPTTPPQATFPILQTLELRRLEEHRTLVLTPDDAMFEVDMEPEALRELLKLCDGTRTIDQIAEASGSPADFVEVIDILLESGALSITAADEQAAAPRIEAPIDRTLSPNTETRLLLCGDERLISICRSLNLGKGFAEVTVIDREHLRHDLDNLDPERDLPLVLEPHLDAAFLAEIDAACAERGLSWSQFHLDRGKAWLGPIVIPGRTADYRDLIDRRMCCSDNETLFAAEMSLPIYPNPDCRPVPSPPALVWSLSRFFEEIERWRTGQPCRLYSTELSADFPNRAFSESAILPMPHRRLGQAFLTSSDRSGATLVNDRTGVVVRHIDVVHHESVPETLVTVQAHVSNIARKYPCANDVIVGGSSFSDPLQAKLSSLGEAIERYCGNYIPGEETRRASYRQLAAAGEHAIDPESLILFDEAMYREPGCPMIPFSRDLEVLWVRGRSLTRNAPAWLPVSLVYVNWHTGLPGEPITNYYWFPGIAAGVNLDHALVSGLEEIIERDITMIWWMNAQPLPSMIPTPEMEALWRGRPTEMGQRPWLIHLDNEFDVPVIAGVLENTVEGYFNIGFGCRPDPVEAAFKAWSEALTLQEGSRDMDDPNGLLRTSVEEWGLIDVPYKPWRADRRYLDDYRADFRDVSDLLQQQQVNLDPRCLERARAFVDTPRSRPFSSLPSLPDRSLQTLQKRVESRGYEIFYKDITTADVDLMGLKAARVIVPGLVPNTSAAFPPLGGERLRMAPVDMGWRERPLSPEELNYTPLPHA
ncbi:YcaO-like family protein [Sulfidibacter corallicola]|uniref:YcaO-like family protein n=1 Tax=Sulfidibacter corallicola TaxID=2818388 RepID=A0A8A4TKQ5_SULCO|nr:YcaO-like family protein [Sulfidibacter corallicola]QTD49784.1 YcaO-like family protein [Sulfidibacter corallicola]